MLFVLFARVIISRPQQSLTMRINNTPMDNFPNAQAQEPGNAEKNEIVVLNTAFEAMLKKLSEAHAQLKAHSVELEMKVAERTEELVNREEKLKIAYNQLQVARYKELEALNDKR